MAQTIDTRQVPLRGRLRFHIRSIDRRRPWRWLAEGWHDYAAHPWQSVLYGALFVAAGWWLGYYALQRPVLLFGFLSGLLLITPLLATGLYEAARCRRCGEIPTIRGGLRMVGRKLGAILTIGAVLLIILIAWLRVSALLIALKFHVAGQSAAALSLGDMLQWQNLSWLALYLLIGLAFAAAVFVTNNLSLPLMIDRDADAVTAMVASIRAVRENPGPMLRWAAIIVGLSLVGVATGFLGFLILFPLLGYATWHSYADLVAWDD